METTNHEMCRALAELSVVHGVRYAVLSPGSRNAPLLVAFAREKAIKHHVVIDERVAAFMALGMAARLQEPVALVCTSGTALLNYAPAVAEAYYRHVPLIVISADRPDEWIDQDDSQTIRQRGIFAPFIKASYHLPVDTDNELNMWYATRMINEAILTAKTSCPGPVHVNVPLREPLCGTAEYIPGKFRKVQMMKPARQLAEDDLSELTTEFARHDRIMVFASLLSPSASVQSALSHMADLPQVMVLTESVSNVHDPRFIPTVDRVLTAIDNSEKPAFAPSLLITLGGAPISRMAKLFLRRYAPAVHWRIGGEQHIIDTMQNLTCQIDAEPAWLLEKLAQCPPRDSGFAALWKERETYAGRLHNDFIESAPWSALKAYSILFPSLPEGVSLHLSNGTSVRYAQLFNTPQVSKTYSNRGVSGIDGSTSTAIGSSCVDNGTTLLVTGDMSFAYDAGGLATGYATPRFKVVVLCNEGGGIFRFIKGPSDLPELEECFEVKRRIPVEGYAALHGFRFFKAASIEELRSVLPRFGAEKEQPAMLALETDGVTDAAVLRAYMRRARS